MFHQRKRPDSNLSRPYAWLLLCFITLVAGTTTASAALLDGFFNELEESLAQKLSTKGEKLTIGNFYTPERADSHGPIGMMGDHTHNEGELMFSYRYMQMYMEGNQDGTKNVSSASVVSPTGFNFIITPTAMRMEMHMFGAMYGVNEILTLTAMLPYLRNSMDHVNRMGVRFKTRSNGAGDFKVGSLWRLYAFEAPSIGAHRFHFNFTVSLPTGSITETDATPLGIQRLPYPMQLGSGTVDILPGMTYTGGIGNATWGFQTIGTYRIARNAQGYSKGDEYQVGLFGAYSWAEWVSNSVRFNWKQWFDYDGQDTKITSPAAQQLVYTADPDLRAGKRLDILAGMNFLLPEILGLEHRLAVEGGVPIYQNLDGPQLETDFFVTFGWQIIH